MRLRVADLDLEEALGDAVHLLYLGVRQRALLTGRGASARTVCERPWRRGSSKDVARANGDGADMAGGGGRGGAARRGWRTRGTSSNRWRWLLCFDARAATDPARVPFTSCPRTFFTDRAGPIETPSGPLVVRVCKAAFSWIVLSISRLALLVFSQLGWLLDLHRDRGTSLGSTST
jgi:hypothetical protein